MRENLASGCPRKPDRPSGAGSTTRQNPGSSRTRAPRRERRNTQRTEPERRECYKPNVGLSGRRGAAPHPAGAFGPSTPARGCAPGPPGNSSGNLSTKSGQVHNCLRKLPGTRDQIANLEPRLREYERKSLDELRPIGPDFDPSELAEKARSAMRGKPLSEALPLLAAIVRPQSFSFHQELVEQAMKSSPVHHIFPLTLLNAEGAAIAQRSGLNSDTAKAEDPAFRAEMFRDMRLGHAVSVFGFIYPAKQQLLDEHDVRLADFRHLALCSSFVPPGREEIFARGLFAGMTDDYLTAAHLLVPQVEWTCPDLVDRLPLEFPGGPGAQPLAGVEGPKAPAGCGAAPRLPLSPTLGL